MNRLKITGVKISGNDIICSVLSEGEISNSFRREKFDFTYYCNISMEGVPESIAVLPAVGTLLPLSWLFDASLEVDELDADFYRCIPDVKQGYMNMYPKLEFKGSLTVGRIVENTMEEAPGYMSFFSGGLDSHDTVLRHEDDKPNLLILRGADISITRKDDAGWEEILRQVDSLAETLGVERFSVETNFREAMNYRFLNDWTAGKAQTSGTYWYCFQHGIALATHAAPIAYQKKIGTIFIASSYTEEDEGLTTCASDPTIDNYVKFCGAGIRHDGYEYNRNAKLRNVAAWVKRNDKPVFLRVCHSHPKGTNEKDGRNCCKCEKCYRTILGLYALKEDPNKFGFDVGDMNKFGEKIHSKTYRMVRMFNLRYLPIIKQMQENYEPDEVPEGMKWFYNFKLDENSEFFKWVDRRVVIEHEKRMAAEIKLKAEQRKAANRVKDAIEEKMDNKNSVIGKAARKLGLK